MKSSPMSIVQKATLSQSIKSILYREVWASAMTLSAMTEARPANVTAVLLGPEFYMLPSGQYGLKGHVRQAMNSKNSTI